MRIWKLYNCQSQCPCAVAREGGRNRGQSLVELALVLPLLLLMLLGAVEFGQLGLTAITVSNAAHAGTIWAQQHPSDFAGMQTAAVNDGSAISSWATITATATGVCTCSNGTVITCSTTSSCASPAYVENYNQIQTQATVEPILTIPGLPRSYTLNGYAIMKVPQ